MEKRETCRDFLIKNELKFGDIFLIDKIKYIFISYAYSSVDSMIKYDFAFACRYETKQKGKDNVIFIDSTCYKYNLTKDNDKTFLLKEQLSGVNIYENSYYLVPVSYKDYLKRIQLMVKANRNYAKINEPKNCTYKGKDYIILGMNKLEYNSAAIMNVKVCLYLKGTISYVSLVDIDNIRKLQLIKIMY